jgi:polysaccharide export outer membrane protein
VNGDINFPVLGKLHVEDMTQSEAIKMIEDKLRTQIVDPIVTLRFLNARVTVLGEVKNPGTYYLNNGRISILEALGMAGDITQYGRRDNVLISRENNGKLEFARLDLRGDEVFKSPYFYLQQNDVVMVEPNQARTTSNQSISLWLSMVGTLSSATTVIVSVVKLQK